MIITMLSHFSFLEKSKVGLRWFWLHRPNFPIPWHCNNGYWMLLYNDEMGWGLLKKYEDPIVKWTKSYVKPGMLCVDGGANQGFYSLLFLGLGASVVSFEPNIFEYRRMTRNIKLNTFRSVHLKQVYSALSNSSGIRSLYVVPHHASRSSLRPPAPDVPSKGSYWDVPVVLLDEEVTKRVDLIKLDVEGAEKEALLGGVRIIERDRPALIVEIADVATRQFGYTGRELLNYIIENLRYERLLSHRRQGLNEEYYRDTMVFLPKN